MILDRLAGLAIRRIERPSNVIPQGLCRFLTVIDLVNNSPVIEFDMFVEFVLGIEYLPALEAWGHGGVVTVSLSASA